MFDQIMRLCIEEAREFQGATSPNPPVGAAALSASGRLLGITAHERAGAPHAEAALLAECEAKGSADLIHTLIVTLEPCCHHGLTGPCVEAILKYPSIKRVVVGVRDPNPKVDGRGIARLQAAGIEVIENVLEEECLALIAPFSHWIRTGRPWVTIKTALRIAEQGEELTMIPPAGTKTFTSQDSLILAHSLRKRADALLTGSGTVLSDFPEFTVRHISDHPEKKRWLIVLDRRGQISREQSEWLERAAHRGFEIRTDFDEVLPALDFLGSQGALEVLVEAGPTLTRSLFNRGLWNEHVLISQGPDKKDKVEVRFKHKEGVPPCSLEL